MTTDRSDGGTDSGSAGRFRRWAAGLFDQQAWCWGRDVARPEGNVLLGLGMCRYRPPGGGGSLYTAATAGGGSVFLWGFGVLYSEPGAGGVFVRRHGFTPRLTPVESPLGVHEPGRLRGLTRPVTARQWTHCRRLLPALAAWVARYEHWVAESLGTAYRERCLTARGQPAAVAALQMAAAWERAAKKCRRFGGVPEPARGPWAGLVDRLRREAASPGPPTAPGGAARRTGPPPPPGRNRFSIAPRSAS